MTKFIKSYQKLVDDISSQGDKRYFDSHKEEDILFFLVNGAIFIETKDVSDINKEIKGDLDDIEGPQKELKLLSKQIFKEFGVSFIQFEKRIPFGVVDVLGKKDEKTIFVECGPCRIDKCFNYLRENNTELWIVTSEFDPHSTEMGKSKLHIIKRGKNWKKTVDKYDELLIKKLKKIKSPLDSL